MCSLILLFRQFDDGSCACVAFLRRLANGSTAVKVANLGDSRAILGMFQNGTFDSIAYTEDHQPTAPAERERIMQAGGTVPTVLRSLLRCLNDSLPFSGC